MIFTLHPLVYYAKLIKTWHKDVNETYHTSFFCVESYVKKIEEEREEAHSFSDHLYYRMMQLNMDFEFITHLCLGFSVENEG